MNRYHQLSQQERYTITSLLISRKADAEIARCLQRSPSTICRELARNRTHHDSNYRAELAHSYATARRRRVRRGSHFAAHQWQRFLGDILRLGADFGRSAMGAGQKVLVEFVSANPTGPLHLGHGRGAALGDTLCRILAFTGHEVVREFATSKDGHQGAAEHFAQERSQT
jgi:arginyl-tRNA synthetase